MIKTPDTEPIRRGAEALPVELTAGAHEAPRDSQHRELTYYIAAFIVGVLVAAAVVAIARVPVQYVVAGLAALAYGMLSARLPAWGCAVLVAAVPLVEGLGRNTVIPGLRPSEAMMAVLVVGVLVHEIPRRARRNFSVMDVAVLAFALGTTLVPVLYILYNRQTIGFDSGGLLNVFAPLEYLATYLLFSRIGTNDRDRRLFLNLAMAASVVVSLVGIAQLADLPGVQSFLGAYYPADEGLRSGMICQASGCRPTSLMQHFSAFGGYCVLSYTLALALLSDRATRFDRRWLVAVLALNAIGVFASLTVAAVLGMVLATVIVMVYRRSLPKQLLVVGAIVVIGAAAFWGPLSNRISQQAAGQDTIAGISVPESAGFRTQYWTQVFWPALEPRFLTGTGAQMPGDIPASLSSMVDNEYLRMGFRAGVTGEVLLLVMLAVVAVTGWRARKSRDPLEAAIGGVAATYVIVLAVMGTTAEYFQFAGIDQVFWMALGMLGGFRVVRMGAAPEREVQVLGEAEPGRLALGRRRARRADHPIDG
jgi:hypothetical protein